MFRADDGASVGRLETFDDVLAGWIDAEARGDATALDALLDDDFRGDGPRGYVLTKQQWLNRYRTGDLANDAFAWEGTRVRVHDDAAVAMGIQAQTARYQGPRLEWSVSRHPGRGAPEWPLVDRQRPAQPRHGSARHAGDLGHGRSLNQPGGRCVDGVVNASVPRGGDRPMPVLEATRENAECAPTREAATLQTGLEQHRRELTGYCRRVLGSAFEAEDAVQETLVRAWRNFDRFEGRATLRSWLYRIATNVCADMMRRPQRRARPMDLGPPADDDGPRGAARAPGGAAVTAGDPAEMAASRETMVLALIVLQQLPSRQRAVLILREVLRWKAEEVAELLGVTVASVNSALQRARCALAAADVSAEDARAAVDATRRKHLAACVDAFGQVQVETLMALLHRDATESRRNNRRVPGTT